MIVIVTVVMSLMMRICPCFTTDTRDLNGLAKIMFHQHRVTITQNILGGPVHVLDAPNAPSECFNLFLTEQIF